MNERMVQPLPPPTSSERTLADDLLPKAAVVALLGLSLAPFPIPVVPPLAFAAAAGLVMGAKFPVASFGFIFLLTGAIGTIDVYTPIPPRPLCDLLLAGLMLGAIGRWLNGSGRNRVWVWPALFLPVLYVVFTTLQIPLADSLSTAVSDYRLTIYYMIAALLIGLGPWPNATFTGLARVMAVVAALVGAYCAYRYFAGSSFKEQEFARASQPSLSFSTPLRFFGSFPSAQQLSAWSATVLPFVLALGFGWRGRYRWAALIAAAGLTVALLGADVRTGIAAGGAGAAAVIVLFVLARSSQGRAETVFAAAVAILALAFAGYQVTAGGNEEQADRISNILKPGDDFSYSIREDRWAAALEDMQRYPLGHGLGTQGQAGASRPEGPVVTGNIDSSYLKIGLEQGYPGLVLFALALLAMVAAMARRAIAISNPTLAPIAIGGTAALVSFVVLMYGSTYVEGLTALSAWMLVGLGIAVGTHRPELAPARHAVKARQTLPATDVHPAGAS